ncbi:molybdopterin-guanine dinucleotide biosynthesis protein B [Sporolactobacillus sp. CQH2019]|uniref:molybdopterin-guanine dinucleotide biosynthesis protein B n=1 Tax=Sporolactobacillus sp. CQH2019 TaxID=3023512 RepID=UPI002367D848|nr:molybdopterin-guanine dinucleotide biosynthesis protein B [Sporolactobacillus sp. CQH2019]MDD9149604.1 molybdopterin-guanine dinucleotide biosynthesis protein B [Sporolactobacillus sp. CQH2019]
MVPTLQIVGYKKSGKTQTINDLLVVAAQFKKAAVVLKHDIHGAQMDRPGTDTAAFTAHGAKMTVLVSGSDLFIHQKRSTRLLKLSELLGNLPPHDLQVLEGFKAADYPKLVLLRSGETLENLPPLTHVIAAASLTSPSATDVLDFSGSKQRQEWFATYFREELKWKN